MSNDKRFLSLADLINMPEPRWAVEGLFERDSLTMIAGPPASCKSFLALDWILCMATGKKWQSRATTPARVLYVLGEGKASLLKRLSAWLEYHQIKSGTQQYKRLIENFRTTWDVPQLAVKVNVDNMLVQLEAEDFKPEVIVIDTFARSFVGMDENSQQDMGLWVEQADRLRQMGFTVIIVHHTAKNTEFGLKYRGSSALMGALDSAFTMQPDRDTSNCYVLECVKQKDHDEGKPLYFRKLVISNNDPNNDGSMVLIPTVKVSKKAQENMPKEEEVKKLLDGLLADPNFGSDRARARELARLAGMSESAAQTKISRAKRDEVVEPPQVTPEIPVLESE